MKKKCNLWQSRLSFVDMRFFIIIGILCLLTPAAFAQAADINAIDLSGKMDTIAMGSVDGNLILGEFLNVGFQNSDNWQDFEINYGSGNPYSKLRFGGPMIFDTINNPRINDYSSLYGDFDGDGIGDIIAHNGVLFFKGKSSFPFFDLGSTSELVTHYTFESFDNPRAIDFDNDNIVDCLVSNGDHRVRLYKGGSTFGKSEYTFAVDSIQFPGSIVSMVVGFFGLHTKPTIACVCNNNIYLLKHAGNTFAEDSITLICDSTRIRPTNLYSIDVTGDGITDLIVSDGLHLYIFKGGDDFGTYQLTPQNAFYTIKSPYLTDNANYGFIQDFGTYSVRACGDLTGSGTPYFEVDADINQAGFYKTYAFFYAGGKALDTLYDAVISYETNGYDLSFDTLHSINSNGRTVCLITNKEDYIDNLRDLGFLMSRDCEKIPHKINPQMAVHSTQMNDLNISVYPSIADKFMKVHLINSVFCDGSVTVYNLLGIQIENRQSHFDIGENTEYFNTARWGEGTYIVKIQTPNGIQTEKFSIRR